MLAALFGMSVVFHEKGVMPLRWNVLRLCNPHSHYPSSRDLQKQDDEINICRNELKGIQLGDWISMKTQARPADARQAPSRYPYCRGSAPAPTITIEVTTE